MEVAMTSGVRSLTEVEIDDVFGGVECVRTVCNIVETCTTNAQGGKVCTSSQVCYGQVVPCS